MGSHQVVKSNAYKQHMGNENNTAKNSDFLILLA